jgi:hypothetical protein
MRTLDDMGRPYTCCDRCGHEEPGGASSYFSSIENNDNPDAEALDICHECGEREDCPIDLTGGDGATLEWKATDNETFEKVRQWAAEAEWRQQ